MFLKAQDGAENFITFLNKSEERGLREDFLPAMKILKKESKDYDFVKIGLLKDHIKNSKLMVDLKNKKGLGLQN